jgi:glycosyltransferase involved in cell wall biosynthesis
MQFSQIRFYGNRPLTKARSDPASFAAHLRAYARRSFEVQFFGPNWRVPGEIPPSEIHQYFRIPRSVHIRHVGPRLSETSIPRLLRLSLALPALAAGRASMETLHYHRDPLGAVMASRYGGIHILAVVLEPRNPVDRLALLAIDGLVANTPALAERYRVGYPFLRDRVIGIRGSYDTELFEQQDRDRAIAKAALGIEPWERTVGYAGEVPVGSEELAMIVRACAGLEVTLLVAGSDWKAHNWLLRSSPPDVRVVARPLMPPAELPGFLAAADVLVSYYPSSVLTLDAVDPGKIYPYLGSGRPVVSAAHPSMADLLVHEVNAELASPDDPDALRQALAHVLDNPDYAHRLAAHGRKTALSHTIDAKVGHIIELARGLAERRIGTIH